MNRLDLTTSLENREHARGARQGDDGAHGEGGGERQPGRERQERDDQHRHAHLKPARQDPRAPERTEFHDA